MNNQLAFLSAFLKLTVVLKNEPITPKVPQNKGIIVDGILIPNKANPWQNIAPKVILINQPTKNANTKLIKGEKITNKIAKAMTPKQPTVSSILFLLKNIIFIINIKKVSWVINF